MTARRLRRAGLAIAIALGAATTVRPDPVAAQTPPAAPTDVRPLADEIDAWRLQQHERLRGTPNDTRENHRLIDEQARVRGRQAEPIREDALRKIFEKAGVEQPRYTGTGPAEAGSGGVLGDQDLASLSARDYAKVMQAAEDLHFKVTAKGDSMTIEELQVTTHRAAAEKFGPTGSSASETASIGRASNKETAVSFGIDPETGQPIVRDAHLKTLDNLKKAGELLAKDPAEFTLKEWADWAKMVGRNMDAAGIQDPALRTTLENLKIRDTPDSAGVTPDRATPAERATAIKDFVTRANEVNQTAYAKTKAQSAAIEAALRRQIDAAADVSARSEAKAKLIDYLKEQSAARDSVVRNKGGKVLNNLDGVPPGERPLTPSQVDEAAVKPGRSKVTGAVKTPVDAPVAGATPVSRTLKYGGPLVMIYGAVAGALEGAKQARAEAKPGEWFVTTAAKGTAYGVLYTLGIPEAFRVGTDAGNESMRQFQADLAAGNDPSLAWAKLRGVGTALFQFGKAMTIDPAVMLAESGGGAAGDVWRAYRAELDHMAAEQVQSQQAVGIARNLARDLAAAVKAADAEIKLLRPLAARVEETRRLTNQLRTRLDALQTANDIHCRRAAAGSAAAPVATTQAVDAKLPAELVDITKVADGVCRAADQAVSAFKQQQINAEGVSFRLENALRRPQQDAERRLDAARRSVDALAGSASGDAALLQVAERTYQEAAALAQQATALALSIDTTTAAFQYEVTKLRTAATQAADMRQRFIGGVKRFSGVSPEQDAELRGLVEAVSPLKIDAAGIAELEAAARSFAALSALLTNDIARRVPPPCPALAALADRWAAIWQRHGDLETALDEAAARVTAGRMCLDRVTALVPVAPPITKPPPPPTRPATALEDAVKAALRTLGYDWRPAGIQGNDIVPPKDKGGNLLCSVREESSLVWSVCRFEYLFAPVEKSKTDANKQHTGKDTRDAWAFEVSVSPLLGEEAELGAILTTYQRLPTDKEAQAHYASDAGSAWERAYRSTHPDANLTKEEALALFTGPAGPLRKYRGVLGYVTSTDEKAPWDWESGRALTFKALDARATAVGDDQSAIRKFGELVTRLGNDVPAIRKAWPSWPPLGTVTTLKVRRGAECADARFSEWANRQVMGLVPNTPEILSKIICGPYATVGEPTREASALLDELLKAGLVVANGPPAPAIR